MDFNFTSKLILFTPPGWVVFLIVFCCSGSAVSQESKFPVTKKKVPLQEIISHIERTTDYRFFYNNDEVDVNYEIEIAKNNDPVDVWLEKLFQTLPYKIRQFENNLFLIEAKLPHEMDVVQQADTASWKVTGTVTDNNGLPLPGVSLSTGNLTRSTVTGEHGQFALFVPRDDNQLIFSFLGKRTRRIAVDGDINLDVVLTEETYGLEEIVVIGYGSVRKADLTGSISVIAGNELLKDLTGRFTRSMQGKAPGLYISQNGSPGTEAQIRVRGVGSINHESNPIFVVDGVITPDITFINPLDIETIQVLKDASASAIYGADGANGVIIVSTKRGGKGAPKIVFSNYISFSGVPRHYTVLNAQEYSSFYSRILTENGIAVPIAYQDPFREWYYGENWKEGTNWQNAISRIAFGQNYSLSISGGGEGSNYFVSAGYYSDEGTLEASSASRLSLQANSDFNLGNFIKISETINLSRQVTQVPENKYDNPWVLSLIASPLMKIHNKNNKGGFEGPQIPYDFSMQDGSTDLVVNTGLNDKMNPLAPLKLTDNRDYSNKVLANISLEITPFKGLALQTMPSVDAVFFRRKNWLPAYDLGVRSKSQAELLELFSEAITLSIENQITYSNTWNGHHFTATAVHHRRKSTENLIEVRALGFPYEQLNVISQSYESDRQVMGYLHPFASESFLGRIIYDYKGKYLMTASLRRDGNSRFGPENRWGTFPSISAGWKINEDIFAGVKQINLLKFRLGWGRTGNSGIGNFQYMSLIDGFNNFSPVFGLQQKMVPALNVIHSMGNPSIKWEAADMINFGLDLNLFKNQLQLTTEYFVKNQNDLLVRIPMSAAYGRFAGGGDPWVNLGELQNKGFEFSGLYRNMENEFKYAVTANFSTMKNKVKYIPGEIISDNNLTKTGHTTGSFYGFIAERILTPEDFSEDGNYRHAIPATGKPSPGDLKFKDLNNDGRINDLDKTIIGKAIPDFTYGLKIETFYKNFDLSLFLNGFQNFDIYNHTKAAIEGFSWQDIGHNKLRDYILNYYTTDRPSTRYIRADLNNTNLNDRPSTWYLEDGSFLKIRDIQLGYSFTPRLHESVISNARLFLSVSNAFTITRYSGRDPEAATMGEPLSPGNDNGVYPVPRTLTFGFHIGF